MNRNIIAAILIIIGIGLYFTVTQSMIADAQAVKAKNDQLTTALDNAQQIITSRDGVTTKYNSIPAADRAKLDKMIPSAVDNIRLVIDLNNMALQNHFALSNVKAAVPSNSAQNLGASARQGVSTPVQSVSAPVGSGSMSPVQSVSEPVLDKVQISFGATATYDQFINFLRAAESDLRIMDMTHLTITANNQGTYDFQVQFQTYWLRQ